ncbi:HD domain-containing protein, partial [Pseudomonas brassicacearum]|uniref:HD domain-containing protein n=1 Tax=Pseudomonas brassicacearum TaxID=930166 RepID=UPI000F46ABDF
ARPLMSASTPVACNSFFSWLIDGVQRMAAISDSLSPRKSLVLGTQGQVENLRKMLVAMVDDVRVALIKLAERTCAIRAVKTADDENRNRVAREV